MLTVSGGIVVCLAAHLVVAGILKLRNTLAFEVTLVRLVPMRTWRGPLNSRRAARAIAALEVSAGAALILVGTAVFPAATYVACGLFLSFVVASYSAYRIGVPCGCFGSKSVTTQRADIARTAVLAVMAGFVVVAGLSNRPSDLSVPSIFIALGAAMLAWSPVILARGSEQVRRAIRSESLQHRPAFSQQPGLLGGQANPEAQPTRRRFLHVFAATTIAAVGATLLGASAASAQAGHTGTAAAPAAPASRSCSQLFTLCRNCCRSNHTCYQCCEFCYTECNLGIYSCHGGDCYYYGQNCWLGG